ncbi:zinc finger protein 761-like isoform X2 [Neocloeon triangulifer]|uniref:zinc finger protein 761-like isoform X2 n=1 Tax=Neocloeon triangulifer TaxID=2078957 RepID=UPI00286F6F6A|nr:zinc finger protein 761-like isoform X2 [Neocloeon triangulifer]
MNICSKIFSTAYLLRRHQTVAHSIGINPKGLQPTCNFCFKKFQNAHTYDNHRKTCAGRPTSARPKVQYPCPYCDKICTSVGGLKSHTTFVHPTEKRNAGDTDDSDGQDEAEKDVKIYICLDCGKTSSGHTGFYRHKMSYCNPTYSKKSDQEIVGRRFCWNCEQSFEFPSTFKKHFKICSISIEEEIALVNKTKKCHYFQCNNNLSEPNFEESGVRLFHISLTNRQEYLERMNVASLAPNIPTVSALRICSKHFPESAFQNRPGIIKMLQKGSLPFDWRDSFSKDEVAEIEARISYKKGDDILEFIDSQRALVFQQAEEERIAGETTELENQRKSGFVDPKISPSNLTAPLDDEEMDTHDLGQSDFQEDNNPVMETPKEKICRLCGEEKEGMVGIYDEAGKDLNMPFKMQEVLPIKISENDSLPHQVCIQCAGGIDFIYQMYNKIKDTDKALQSKYAPLEEENYQQSLMDMLGGDNVDEINNYDDFPGNDFFGMDDTQDQEYVEFSTKDEEIFQTALRESKNPLNEASYAPLVCSSCEIQLDNADAFVDHYRVQHKQELTACPLCQVFFDSIFSLRQHWYQLHLKILHNTEVELANGHKVKIQRKPTKYQCKQCKMTFDKIYLYKSHLSEERRKRQNKSTLQCDYCDEMFESEMDKTWHMLNTHQEYLPFECSKCKRRFRLKHSRDLHERCHKEDSHLCNTCGKILPDKMMLKLHLRQHMDPVPCPVCAKEFIPDKLRTHMKIHKDKRPYQCTKCDEAFQFLHLLKRHETQVHVESKFKCSQCSFASPRRTLLNSHMNKVHGTEFKSVIKCRYKGCSEVFDAPRELYEHTCREHSKNGYIERKMLDGTDGYFCRYCEQVFDIPTWYSSHIKKVHPDVENAIYTCSVCKFETPILGELDTHLEQHAECCRFQCQQCPMMFSTSRRRGSHEFGTHFRKKKMCQLCGRNVDNMKEHMNVHKGIKPYKCPTCDQAFHLRSQWKSHLSIHLDIRIHKCRFCEASFRTKPACKMHEKLHTAETIYECESCDYACTSKQSIRKHNQKFHIVNKLEFIPEEQELQEAAHNILEEEAPQEMIVESIEMKEFSSQHRNVVEEQVVISDELMREDEELAKHVTVLGEEEQISYFIVEMH